MPIRNPLRSGYAVLVGASLGVFSGAAIGCNVYDEDMLLSNPTHGSRDDAPGTSVDAATSDDNSVIDPTPRDGSDARALDTIATDTLADGSGGKTADISSRDGTVDAGATRPDADGATWDNHRRDAIATGDADATTGARDADASAPPPDPSDAGLDDGGDADGAARDGASAPPDVDSDIDAGSPPPTFRVLRVGDGTTELSGESAPAFIEERRWDGQLIGRALALPTIRSGAQHPLTLSGIATSEGALALSLDGRYLALAGYATAPGRGSIASSTNVERVVARVDAAGTIDTSTMLGGAFSGANARSAASVDGTAFWIGGASGGVWYAAFGGMGLTQIVSSPDNVRLVALFSEQLYGCSGTSPMTTVFTVGSGRPITGGQSVAALAGLPLSGMSPYAFAFFDLNATVAGLDTLYLADDRSPESDGTGGGIQKWTFDGSAWSRVATFTTVGGGSASFRGIAGMPTAAGVILVASTAESGTNRLAVFLDQGSPGATGIVVATAPRNTMFRGVALSPHP